MSSAGVVVLDVEAIARRAAEAAVERARQEWRKDLEAALAERGAALEPLTAILGGTPARCRMLEKRHPSLRALAHVDGRRRMYRREEVVRYFAEGRGKK